jgi:cell division protein FtsB
MTRQEQIEEMAKIVDEMYNVYTTTEDDIADGLYNAGYRKVDDLKAENKQLKTECALLDDELRIARQETIDVLNKLKTKAFDKDAFNGWAGSTFVVLIRDIDKMIEELTK